MKNKIYTITLSDGTTLENLKLNGDNFISKVKVDAALFVGNCSPLIISDGENEEIHEHAELVQITEYDGEYWIVFRDISEQEIRDAKVRADIDYMAMMTNVDLEDA